MAIKIRGQMSPRDAESAIRTPIPVIVFAPEGRDAQICCRMLAKARLPCVICNSAGELMEKAAEGAGPAIVAVGALNAQEAADLNRLLDLQPPWSDLPLIIFTPHNGIQPWHQCLAMRGNAALLQRPVRIPAFVSVVRAAVNSRARQYEVRDLLRRLELRAAQLQALALELTTAEERERDRLALLLHDDLQQLLVGAMFHAQMLPERSKSHGLEPAAQEIAGLIKQAIEKSRKLSQELSPPVLRQHGLIAALHWQADRMQEMHGLKVKVDAVPSAEPPGTGLNALLFRCAQELLFNVVKHAGVKHAQLSFAMRENVVCLRVQDAGKGFEPATLQDGSRSPGFGLFSIQERITLLGGKLEVQSSPAIGSVFTLTMPLCPLPGLEGHPVDLAVVDAAIPHSAPPGRIHPKLRIALVDDHLVMRSGLKALLANQDGIDIVAEADNGREAVEMAQLLQPDLILMDVSMPEMDGIEATRRIKASYPQIRVIGLSMFDDQETAEKMCKAGAEQYLSKAGSGEKLLLAVRG